MRISLCLLTYDEIEGCRHDVPLIDRSAFEEIYAVDAGSTDGTIEYLGEQGIPVYQQPVKSLNAACCHAVEKCTTDALVFFHPKGVVPVSDTLRFRPLFEEGYELVVASRNMKGASNEEDDKLIRPRKWLAMGMAALIALLWRREGGVVWDLLHGFRGATMAAFRQIDLTPVGVSVDLEMVARAYKFRMKRTEFPTRETERMHGESHFKILPTGKALLRFVFFELGRRDGGTGEGKG